MMTEVEVTRRNIERYEGVLHSDSADDTDKQKVRKMLVELRDKLADLTPIVDKPLG